MNGPSYLEQYARAILSGEITAGRRIKQQMRHLLDKIEHPEKYEPYIFDPAVADHHIEFIEKFCKQSQGRRGEPLTLELFQKARLEAIFGFVDKNTGYRQYNEVLIIEGRKNGKTTETAAIELDMLLNDGAGAPEIYNIATRLEQAKKGFVECWNMQRNSTAIRKLVRKRQNDLFCAVNLGFIINLIFAKSRNVFSTRQSRPRLNFSSCPGGSPTFGLLATSKRLRTLPTTAPTLPPPCRASITRQTSPICGPR